MDDCPNSGPSPSLLEQLGAIPWPKNGELAELVLRLPDALASEQLLKAGLPAVVPLFYQFNRTSGEYENLAMLHLLRQLCAGPQIQRLLQQAQDEIQAAVRGLPSPDSVCTLDGLGGLSIPVLVHVIDSEPNPLVIFSANLALSRIQEGEMKQMNHALDSAQPLSERSRNLRALPPSTALFMAHCFNEMRRQADATYEAHLREVFKARPSSFGGRREPGIPVPFEALRAPPRRLV